MADKKGPSKSIAVWKYTAPRGGGFHRSHCGVNQARRRMQLRGTIPYLRARDLGTFNLDCSTYMHDLSFVSGRIVVLCFDAAHGVVPMSPVSAVAWRHGAARADSACDGTKQDSLHWENHTGEQMTAETIRALLTVSLCNWSCS